MPRATRSLGAAAALLAVAVTAGCAAKAAPATASATKVPATPAPAVAGPPAFPATTLAPVLTVPPASRGRLSAELDPYFGAPPLSTAVWSVLVQSLDTGEVLYRLNPDTLVMPASNQKIVTTAVAAARLGWDFRFETRLETNGTVRDGVLVGDLVVVGNGDPTINAREGRHESLFDEMAAALRTAGVTRVEGRLVGDDDAFEDERFGFGWQWDDVAFGYGASVGPLQANMNTVQAVVVPGGVEGAPALVSLRPGGSDLLVVNRVVTGPPGGEARVRVDRYPARRELVVEGTVPAAGAEVVRTAAVDNPTQNFVGLMKLSLETRGIVISGDAVDVDDVPAPGLAAATGISSAAVPPPARPVVGDSAPAAVADGQRRPERRVLARIASPPLSDFAKTLMKISQNLYAETTLRALSLSPGPATVEASAELVAETLSRWGVAPATYVVADGSGLSRHNLVSASMIVAILRAMARDPQLFEPFLATMPVAGEDGTLGSRMKGTRAAGNVKAKTGTLSHVRSLSGYLTTAGGERVVFAMIANNFTTPSAVVDAAVEGALERVISQ